MTAGKQTMRKSAIAVVALLLTTAGSGCSGIESGSAWVPQSAAITTLGPSFAWMPGCHELIGGGPPADPRFEELIFGMVENGFTDKCYEKTSSEAANFWIGCRITKEILGDPRAEGFAQYTEGTLVICIVDPCTKKHIWRGWAKARLKVADPPENKRERLQRAMDKIFRNLPSQGMPLRRGEQ